MTTDTTLAELALRVLNAQRHYFSTRTPAALAESKRLERELRVLAEQILAEATQPSLLSLAEDEHVNCP